MFTHEIALLVAVATPAAVVVAMNAYAFFTGERHTLLLPGVTRWPAVAIAEPAPDSAVAVEAVPSNDALERLAA